MQGLITLIIIVLVVAAFFKVLPFVAIVCGIVIIIAIIVKIVNKPKGIKTHEAPTNAKIAEVINTKVAGVTFNGIQNILPTLHSGQALTFIREPQNQYDKNAVAIRCAGKNIGHLSATLAAYIAPLMDSGSHVEGKISAITGGGSCNYGCNIEVYVFAKSQEATPKSQKSSTTKSYTKKSFVRELPLIKTRDVFESSKFTYGQLHYIYQKSLTIYSLQELLDQAQKIRPKKYRKNKFNPEPKYSREEAEKELRAEAEKIVPSGLFRERGIEEYISKNIDEVVNKRQWEHQQWQQDKEIFDVEEEAFAEKCNSIYSQNAQIEKDIIMDKCKEDKSFITENIEMRLSKLPFPYQYSANYEYSLLQRTLWLKMDLPNIEDIPQENTQKGTKFKFVEDAFSISVYTASVLFDISAYVEHIHLSAYTVKRNKDGDAVKECVLAIKYTRDKFEGIDYINNCQPQEFCMQFENRCNITATGIMKAVKPYERENANQP